MLDFVFRKLTIIPWKQLVTFIIYSKLSLGFTHCKVKSNVLTLVCWSKKERNQMRNNSQTLGVRTDWTISVFVTQQLCIIMYAI